MRGVVTQLELDWAPRITVIDRLAHAGRQRIIDGIVDAWGRHRPEGPRKQLTPAQERAHEMFAEGMPRGADNAATPVMVR